MRSTSRKNATYETIAAWFQESRGCPYMWLVYGMTADNTDRFYQDVTYLGDPSLCSLTVLCKSLEPAVIFYMLLGKWEICAEI